MRFIPLTNSNYSTIIDDEDYNRVIDLDTFWCVGVNKNLKPQSITSTSISTITGRLIILSRFILNVENKIKRIFVDHKFGDIFDNRKENLRICSNQQNMFNKSKYKNNTSGYKGVFLDRRNNKWNARIEKNGKIFSLGYFKDRNDAALAYNMKASELFGEFARLNIIK